MKVRLSENMIRIRMTRDEVHALCAGESVFLSLPVAPMSMTISIALTEDAAPSAEARGGLRIAMPAVWAVGWPTSDAVGFDFDIPGFETPSNQIRIVVEKDFPCSHDDNKPPAPIRMS